MSNIFYNKSNISKTAEHILANSEENLLCFYGDLGAGKTTLVKAIVSQLGAFEATSSPTFGLVNEYHDTDGNLLAYHIDCYRLEGIEEALDIGIEEYLDADCWVFVEWPERIKSLMPAKRTEVRLDVVGPEDRELEIINVSL